MVEDPQEGFRVLNERVSFFLQSPIPELQHPLLYAELALQRRDA